jgi:hypothetical protein
LPLPSTDPVKGCLAALPARRNTSSPGIGRWRRSAAQLSAAKQPVDHGGMDRYEYAPRTPSELPYASWREFGTERSLRLFALRLHEAGMIRSSPNQPIADSTDGRFLDPLDPLTARAPAVAAGKREKAA